MNEILKCDKSEKSMLKQSRPRPHRNAYLAKIHYFSVWGTK